MTLLKKYIVRTVLGSTALVLLILIGLITFLDFVTELEDLGKGNYQLADIIRYTLLSIPQHTYQLLPIAALIGTMMGLGTLASQNELVAMRAAGLSIQQISKGVMIFALLLMMVAVFVGEVLRPPAEQAARELRSLAQTGTISERSQHGFWTRDGQHFNHIRMIHPDGHFSGITIYEFDKRYQLRVLTRAEQAQYDGKTWLLSEVTQSIIDEKGVRIRTMKRARWRSQLNPGMVNIVIVPPEFLPVWSLLDYIAYLERNYQAVAQYQLAFWTKLMMPLSSVVMVLLAIPFVFGSLRDSSLGGRVFMGVFIGIGFHILNQTFQHTGLVFGIFPWLAAALPTACFAILGAVLMKRVF